MEGSARYLAEQYQFFGSWKLALAACNAGPAAVQRQSGCALSQKTENYAKIIPGS